jgi:hydroxymethylbilane synthase
MLMASAGLTRLSMQSEISEYIEPEVMLPAPGQGALAIQCRANDVDTISLLHPLNDDITARSVNAERMILDALGGGCQLPLGTYIHSTGKGFALAACFSDVDGSSLVRHSAVASSDNLEQKAMELANELKSSGADEIIARLSMSEVK